MTTNAALKVTLAEQNLISALLCDPAATVPLAAVLTADAFSDRLYGRMFEAILAAWRAEGAFDAATLAGNSLLADEDADQVVESIARFYRARRTAQLAPRYIECIGEAARARAAGSLAQQMLQEATSGKPSGEVLAATRIAIEGLAGLYAADDKNTRSAAALFPLAVKAAEERAKNPGVTGIRSGLTDLDEMTNGWKPGQLIVVGGRPAMGKSVLLSNFATFPAMAGKKVLHFSIEMTAEETMGRMICSVCDIDLGRWARGLMQDHERESLALRGEKMRSMALEINDLSLLRPSLAIGAAERLADRWGGLDMVIVDYIQRMRSDSSSKTFDPRVDAGLIVWELKNAARRMGVPVITASQLGRQVDRRDDKRPVLSDFMESGAIEAEADIALFVYRPEYYAAKEKAESGELSREERSVLFKADQEAEIIIGKNRNGPTGMVKVEFQPSFARFRTLQESKW